MLIEVFPNQAFRFALFSTLLQIALFQNRATVRPSVLIADDHRLYADGLSAMLSPAYEVVGIASNGWELIASAMKYKPNLIVTDLSMPQLNGLDAMQALKEQGLQSKFLVLTMHEDMGLAVLSFRLGASAFLLKTGRSGELKDAMEAVLRGECYLSPQAPHSLEDILAEAARNSSTIRPAELDVI